MPLFRKNIVAQSLVPAAGEIVIEKNEAGEVDAVISQTNTGIKEVELTYANGEVSQIDINNNDTDKRRITFTKDQEGNIQGISITAL